MGENVKARDPEEQAVTTGHPWQLGHRHGREGWPDQRTEPCEPAYDVFELLRGKVPGHRWDGWRRLTGYEGYFAACSIAPEWARTTDAAQREEVLQRRAERAKELRDGIVAAAGALAAIAEEVTLASPDPGARRPSGSAGYQHLGGGPSDRPGGREVVAG